MVSGVAAASATDRSHNALPPFVPAARRGRRGHTPGGPLQEVAVIIPIEFSTGIAKAVKQVDVVLSFPTGDAVRLGLELMLRGDHLFSRHGSLNLLLRGQRLFAVLLGIVGRDPESNECSRRVLGFSPGDVARLGLEQLMRGQ